MMRLPLRRIRLAAVLALLALVGAAPITGCESPTGGDSGGGCCKVCRTGKACGDTCIARDKQCTRGAGCACNG